MKQKAASPFRKKKNKKKTHTRCHFSVFEHILPRASRQPRNSAKVFLQNAHYETSVRGTTSEKGSRRAEAGQRSETGAPVGATAPLQESGRCCNATKTSHEMRTFLRHNEQDPTAKPGSLGYCRVALHCSTQLQPAGGEVSER